MKLRQKVTLTLFFILSLCFLGCEEGSLELSIRYDTLGELKSKVPVYFEKTEIGHVDKVVSTDRGDYLVEVSIYPNHKDKATDNSKFFISDDPFAADHKAIIVEQKPQGGLILKKGTIVQGEKTQGLWDGFVTKFKESTKDASEKIQGSMQSLKVSMSERTSRLNEQLERSLDDMDRYLQDFSDSMDLTLNSADLDKLKSSLEDFIEGFKSSSKDVQEVIKRDILPKLKQRLESLRKKLQDEGRADEAGEVDHQINELLNV